MVEPMVTTLGLRLGRKDGREGYVGAFVGV